ncbi:unnamed protein product, partial [Hapterophycus canaliculatus]
TTGRENHAVYLTCLPLSRVQQLGIGTMVVGFCTCSLENFLVGVFQLLLAPIVVGWVWSVWWGCELIQVS